MRILILGGTGAMGISLAKLLESTENDVFITSRSPRESKKNISYIQGNAHDIEFLKGVLDTKSIDVIIDFMAYRTDEFKNRVNMFLNKCQQYFFLSSSRVYAESLTAITEDSPRLLDVTIDKEYLETDEYALAKARQENLLRESGKTNWTIIRPYKTYNSNRLQFGMYEKEEWLYRAMLGKTLVFPKDMIHKKTTLTFGDDVAKAMIGLIGNEKALGQAFHITTDQVLTWGQVLNIYLDVIEKRLGVRSDVCFIDDPCELFSIWNKYQIIYDCNLNRFFSNAKIEQTLDKEMPQYLSMEEGLASCLNQFIDNPQWRSISWPVQNWMDMKSKSCIPLFDVHPVKEKMRYIKYKLKYVIGK